VGDWLANSTLQISAVEITASSTKPQANASEGAKPISYQTFNAAFFLWVGLVFAWTRIAYDFDQTA
jgi:hypothetical protein